MSARGAAAARAAAGRLRPRLGVHEPVAAIVLGSGLADIARRVTRVARVPFAEIPGVHATAVAGHPGELLCGELAGREVLVLSGRLHLYEGHRAADVAFPIRVAHALGARLLLLSNAAGGIRRGFAPGDLMIIEDHLNLTFRNPLSGPAEPTDARFPDMSAPWTPRLVALLRECAGHTGVRAHTGVYAGLLGPSYETPAEIRMLAALGADAVGMSTVTEAIAAVAMGMEVSGLSLITNMASGASPSGPDHDEVIAAGARSAAVVGRVLEEFVARA